MIKTFKLDIEFKTQMTFKTSHAPSIKNDPYLEYIDEFFTEFINDKEAVLYYFKDLTSAYLGGPARFQKQLRKLFKLKQDDLSYYLEVADRCREEVKTFIHNMIEEPANLEIKKGAFDKYMEILLTKFGILRITAASIREVETGKEEAAVKAKKKK